MIGLLKNIVKGILYRGIFPILYKWYSKKPVVKNCVLFIEIRYDKMTNNFTLLYEAFSKKDIFTVEIAFLGLSVFSYKKYIKQCYQMIKQLAVAEYVFVNEGSNVLAALPIRKETKLVQTWHGCGAFKRFGHSGTDTLKEDYYNPYTFVTVSSPEVVDIYADSMRVNRERILPIGVSRTDVFFRKDYIEKCTDEVRGQYSIGEDKKIILYAPTFRGNAQRAESPKLLDVEKLYPGLNEEYVFLYKGHPVVNVPTDIPEKYASFFIDASDEQIEKLMCAADLCITDYSSLIFEYALLERPMYFYAYDYKDYVTERGFYYEFESFVPGPICYTEEELIQAITQQDKKEIVRQVTAFKNRFMSACDGRATDRIIERVISEREG